MRTVALLLLPAAVAIAVPAGVCRAEAWAAPEIVLPKDAKHPVVACTAEELARLRAAWKAEGPAHGVVAGVVGRADKALAAPLTFPPRGGQHNQWYQCDACQMGLKTVDPTHHKCPKCGKVYTGPPYDDVVFLRRHDANLQGMVDAAWAYAVTGDAKYATFASKVLLGYADRYRRYPYHDSQCREGDKAGRSGGHLFEQTLNEGVAMCRQVAPAYDLVHDALGEADRETIRTGLILPMLENIAKHQAGKSNWQTWHNAGMLWGGAALGDVAWVRRAVEDPKNGFLFQMQACVSPEGMWYENSWGYHFYTLSAMIGIVEGARRLDIDLWHHPTLRKMFTLAGRYAMADGSLPRFGDDVQTTLGQVSRYAEPAYHALGTGELAALLPDRPSWDTVLFGRAAAKPAPTPAAGSEVFPGAGHAVLRTRGESGLTAAITFGPYGGFHGHLDKLSFVFFGRGRELGVDPGRARSQAYRLPIHRNWYKATIGHNAVLVDGASQRPAEGKLERFAAGDAWAAVVASCDAAYPGVRHWRMLVMAPTYLLVVDDLAADKPRRFDWVYHNRGTGVRCETAAQAPTGADAFDWWGYVRNKKTGATDGPVCVAFPDQDVTTYLTAAGGADAQVLIGDGPGASVLERVPLAMISRRGKTARFACVLEPVADGKRPAVTAVETGPAPDGFRIAVQNGNAADTIVLGRDHAFNVARGGKPVLESKPQ